MFDFIGSSAAERAVARAAVAAQSSGSSLRHAIDDVAEVNDRVDRLLLVVEAMWSLLRESGYADADLKAMIDRLDGEDGVRDGRRKLKPRRCPNCDSMVEPARESCAICGHDMPHEPTTFAPNI